MEWTASTQPSHSPQLSVSAPAALWVQTQPPEFSLKQAQLGSAPHSGGYWTHAYMTSCPPSGAGVPLCSMTQYVLLGSQLKGPHALLPASKGRTTPSSGPASGGGATQGGGGGHCQPSLVHSAATVPLHHGHTGGTPVQPSPVPLPLPVPVEDPLPLPVPVDEPLPLPLPLDEPLPLPVPEPLPVPVPVPLSTCVAPLSPPPPPPGPTPTVLPPHAAPLAARVTKANAYALQTRLRFMKQGGARSMPWSESAAFLRNLWTSAAPP
jgi:hypothetical protein